ncbi:MAG: ribosome small subunit-dependent GTPase A [Sphaerobacteraceae bacterium]|nr:MAG: ribosome small subunit-dependent GTPase A [Sphaerobacteraceae bacterium]
MTDQSRTQPGEMPPNLVVRGYGKFYDVLTPTGQLLCTVRGNVKRERRKTDPVAVGDRVEITELGNGEGVIESVAPRRRALSREARGRTDVEHVILANPDQLIAVFAVTEPEPHPRMLDRFLLIAERAGIGSVVCVNKIDLDISGEGRKLFDRYHEAGYPVIYCSADSGQGIDELREHLRGKISVLAGPSGVGKSSLLNQIDPTQNIRVGEVSDATGKGRHTTTATTIFRLAGETYIADTPGIRQLGLYGVVPEDLDQYFPEFRPWLNACYYRDCTHIDEPDCAIIEALDAGKINRERYESYRSLRQPAVDDA